VNGLSATEDILISIFAFGNVALNCTMLFLLWRAWKELKSQNETHIGLNEILVDMNRISNENIEMLSQLVTERSENTFLILKNIHERQLKTSRYILDDRERLRAHVERVNELERIAKAVEARFLKEDEQRNGGGSN
jgi:septum formation inhibitor MinC